MIKRFDCWFFSRKFFKKRKKERERVKKHSNATQLLVSKVGHVGIHYVIQFVFLVGEERIIIIMIIDVCRRKAILRNK